MKKPMRQRVETSPYESVIDTRFSRLLANSVLAVLIYLSCEIGRIVGLPLHGLKIAIFWPAAGVSLAALLLFGRKVVPGIFFGNLLYNALHLLLAQPGIFLPFICGVLVSSGSTLQAMASAFIIRILSTKNFLANLKDIFVFLIPAGALACFIACTIGVLSLSFMGYIEEKNIFYIWLTFWLGDTMGMYVMTPFILSWTVLPQPKQISFNLLEALLLAAAFFFVVYYSLILVYPLTHLLIPLILWVTFRYGFKGGTTMVLLITIIGVGAAWQGYGIFTQIHFSHPMLVIASFFEVISGIALVIAGALNEREDAWQLLKNYNANLEKTITVRTKQLSEMHDAFNVKQKLISIGMLTAGIGHEIKDPINQIKQHALAGTDCLAVLKSIFKDCEKRIGPEKAGSVGNTLESLNNCMHQIIDQEMKVNRIVDLVIQTAATEKTTGIHSKPINLPIFINKIIEQKKHEMEALYPGLAVEIQKSFSASVGMIEGVPEDLASVFFQLLDNSWYALNKKKATADKGYIPNLTVKTIDRENQVEVIIHDNGIGIPADMLGKLFQPFFTTKPSGEGSGLALAIVHDIIVEEHHGTITADSKEGLYTEIKITLPKKATI